jgi:AcrR family transcriptional regulator
MKNKAVSAEHDSRDVETVTLKPRDRLLDVAEELFASLGYDGASTRNIALRAGVTLGTVHYHFASKRQLFIAVFERRGRPLAAERLRLLQEARIWWPQGGIPLKELIKRFAFPLLQSALKPGGRAFAQLHARLTTEPADLAEEIRNALHNEVTPAYVDAFKETLPHLSEEALYWRIYFMIGVNTYTLLGSPRLRFLSSGKCSADDLNSAMDHLVPFLEAGFRAPGP